MIAPVVHQRLHLAPGGAGHDGVADAQRPLLHDHRGHRAASRLEVRLEHDPARLALDPGRQLLHLGHQNDLLEQALDPRALEGRDLDHDRVAAPGLGHQLALGELLEHARRIRIGPVHLVDRHDDGDLGRLGMVDGLDRLGHDPVVGRHHKDDDVGHLRAAGPHRREGGVARRVDERDPVALPLDLVGADVLGDASCLPRHHVRGADAVEQQCLAVVHVAHDGDDRRPRPLIGLVLLVLVLEIPGQQLRLLLLARVDQAHVCPDLCGEELDHVVGQGLGRHDHLALQEEESHDVPGAPIELGAEVACGRAPLDDDLALGHRGRRGLVGRELRRLELLEIATAPSGATLRGAPSGHATTSTRGRTARGRARP